MRQLSLVHWRRATSRLSTGLAWRELDLPGATPTRATASLPRSAAGPRGYRGTNRFDWLRPNLFVEDLAQHLQQDIDRLFSILQLSGHSKSYTDTKLAELHKLGVLNDSEFAAAKSRLLAE